MPQVSRPLQVALAAVGLLAVVWFAALRGRSSSSESPSTPAVARTSSPSPGSAGSVYHGSAPGVEGLTRDLQKAHGAAAQSEQNSAQLAQKSAQASGESAAAHARGSAHASANASASAAAHATGGTSATGAAHATGGTSATGGTAVASKTTHKPAGTVSAPAHAKAPADKPATRPHAVSPTAGQAWVEQKLAQRMTVALLFYTPRSYSDSRTRTELERMIRAERSNHVKIVLRVAAGDEVGQYGTFTRVASVYQTPTLLLITPSGEVKPPITGLTDAFSLEQAIDEKTQP